MPVKKLKAPKRIGTYSRRVRHDAMAGTARVDEAAARLCWIASFAHTMRSQGTSFRKIAALLEEEPFRSKIGGSSVSVGMLHGLACRYASGQVSDADYRIVTRRGRRAEPLEPRVRECARVMLLGDYVHAPMTEALVELNKFIARENLGAPMSYDRFKRLAGHIGREDRTPAGFGSRAGELYGSYHATVACSATHEIWTCDAFAAPWRSKVLIPQDGVWVFVRPSVITVQDYKSGATIGYWVSNPARRRDARGTIMTEGFDRDDVLAALLAAAVPALAPASTFEFAGSLCSQIRWDRHSTNMELSTILRDVADALRIEGDSFFGEDEQPDTFEEVTADGEVVGTLVQNPKMPARRPKNRGKLERDNAIFQQMCWSMRGHMQREIPAPMWEGDEGSKRVVAASVGALRERLTPVAEADWPTLEESIAEFDAIVARRNAMINRRTGTSPRARFHQFMPHTRRKGDDLLAVLPNFSAFVTGEGLEVFHHGTSSLFEPVIGELGLRYRLDQQVTGKVDPFYRGLFVRLDKLTYLLPPKDVYWSAEGSAERAAREQRAAARAASDTAQAIRNRELDALHGVGAAERGREEAKESLDIRREAAAQAKEAEETAALKPRRRPRADKALARNAASAEAKAAHDARATGAIAQATTEPTHAPPAPVGLAPLRSSPQPAGVLDEPPGTSTPPDLIDAVLVVELDLAAAYRKRRRS